MKAKAVPSGGKSKPAPKAVIVNSREIEGVHFHVQGSEFVSILRKRVKEHLAKAKDAEGSMVEADAAMTMARAAAEKAGKSVHAPQPRVMAAVAASAPTRSVTFESARAYGGNIEDPVEALRQAVSFHRHRATALAFYADHLLPNVTYVLSEHDIRSYELLEALPEDE